MLDPTTSDPQPFSADDLDISITEPGGSVAVLSVQGEIDSLTTPQLETATRELFRRPADRLVIDLSRVSFLASAGLALLIRSAQQAEARGGRLALVVTTRAVRRPLEITGSDKLFDLYDDLGTAGGGSV